jgi:alkanesulfonate monooxygenase SsuD/methylene tetrahydromethanopterin reductase-like flavin-dependent oxidoreductase (luciferase family)
MPRSRDETRIFNKNKFKLGLFGMNCQGGLSLTKAPERWDASWDHNVQAAKLADAAGLEFLLPIGRWHGYQGSSDTQGTTFETLAWACGLLASTQDITTFGTLHVAFVNPVFAAKQMVTADHIGHGRFGLNVVSGWNPVEFGMMGVDLGDHEGRYDYAEEWLTIRGRAFRLRRSPLQIEGRARQAEAMVGHPADPGECGQFRNGPRFRGPQCGLLVHGGTAQARRPGVKAQILPRCGAARTAAQYFRELSPDDTPHPQRGGRLPSLHRLRARRLGVGGIRLQPARRSDQ